jgi:hypothetical protein
VRRSPLLACNLAVHMSRNRELDISFYTFLWFSFGIIITLTVVSCCYIGTVRKLTHLTPRSLTKGTIALLDIVLDLPPLLRCCPIDGMQVALTLLRAIFHLAHLLRCSNTFSIRQTVDNMQHSRALDSSTRISGVCSDCTTPRGWPRRGMDSDLACIYVCGGWVDPRFHCWVCFLGCGPKATVRETPNPPGFHTVFYIDTNRLAYEDSVRQAGSLPAALIPANHYRL